MASAACVNNVGMLPEGFLDCSTSSSYNPSSSYGWFSPRISFSRDFVEEESKKAAASSSSSSSVSKQKMVNRLTVQEGSDDDEEDLEVVVVGSVKKELFQKVVVGSNNKDFGFGDFEFRLEEDPVKMLDADELFSDGKLVPRQLNTVRPVVESTVSSEEDEIRGVINSVPETAKAFRRIDISDAELYLFSPKAPRCSSRWKELLGLKRNSNSPNPKNHDQNQNQKISSSSSSSLKSGALKHFLHRNNPKSLSQSLDSSLNLPLLRDSDSAEIILPNSLSSSSSSSASSSSNQDEHPPRFSLDSDPKHMSHISLNRNPPRVRLSKSRPPTGSSTSAEIHQHHTSVRARTSMHRVSSSDQSSNQSIGLTIDSPRMNSSGKIVFQSLERSSSSPSTFNGGPRVKHRGVERSYSANVRVTPVLNVPVCSLRGSSKSGGSVFGFFSTTNTSTTTTPQKRTDNNGSSSLRNHHHHHHTSRNRSSTSSTATTTATATNSITDRN